MHAKTILSFILSFFMIGGIMPRGTPDGSLQPYQYASQITDAGLIYQFLWGFSPLDSQGRVLYLDTFNNGLAGTAYLTAGAAKPPTLITGGAGAYAYSPPNFVKLSPGTVANDYVGIFRQHFLGVNTRIGFEAGFVITDVSPSWNFRVDYKPNNMQAYIPRLNYDRVNGKWQIANLSGGFTDIFDMPLPPSGTVLLMQVKFVGDWSTGKYVRALIGDNLIDISSISMPTSTTTYNGFLSAQARAISHGATSTDGNLGYMLLTKDEP